MLKKILIGLAALVAILILVIATRPASFRVERSATFSAPPEVVYAAVADFHRWDSWSPWAKLDPNMKTTYGGATSGVGATYSWTGNDDVGEGRMTITEAAAPSRVRIKLEFLKPFAATNDTLFTFAPSGGGTTVTWAMSGANDFFGKAFSLFADMEGMIGKDFEKGLAQMKGVTEADAKQKAPAAAPPAGAAAPATP